LLWARALSFGLKLQTHKTRNLFAISDKSISWQEAKEMAVIAGMAGMGILGGLLIMRQCCHCSCHDNPNLFNGHRADRTRTHTASQVPGYKLCPLQDRAKKSLCT